MRKESIVSQYEVFFTAGVLGAHFSHQQTGFRQKDVRFFIELSSNWMEATLGESSLNIQNVQVSRFLESLARKELLKVKRQKSGKVYHLTRTGLVRLVSSLVKKNEVLPIDHLFFIYYFLKGYGKLFYDLLNEGGTHFSQTLWAELTALHTPEILLENQLRYIDREIDKIKGRIHEAMEAAKLSESVLESGGKMNDVVKAVQSQFPYELNSRKPLNELIGEIPAEIRKWEMTNGLRYRAQYLWIPIRDYLDSYRAIIKELCEGVDDKTG